MNDSSSSTAARSIPTPIPKVKPIRGRDLTGWTSGHLTVLFRSHVDAYRQWHWICQCICGRQTHVPASTLLAKRRKSCGCVKALDAAKRMTKHGFTKHPLYGSWRSMMSRCYRKSDCAYDRYGGRGIGVCERWLHFPWFVEDMEPTWKPGLSIDRKLNNQHYEPDNCQWSTRVQQARNQRSNHLIHHQGLVLCLTEWSEITGIPRVTIASRIRRNWSPEKALTVPPRRLSGR